MNKLHQKILTILVAGAGLAGLASAQDVNQADREGKTLLMRAADRGLTAEVKRLLATGAQVNTKDNDGETALMMAADEGNAAVVKLLLDAGAYVNDTDEDGQKVRVGKSLSLISQNCADVLDGPCLSHDCELVAELQTEVT